MGTMNRAAFETLIADDIEWLMQQRASLERSHILSILRDCARLYYPQTSEAPAERPKEDA